MNGGALFGAGLAGSAELPFSILSSLGETAAMNRTIEAELARQKNYQRFGQGLFDQHLQQNSLPEANKSIAGGASNAMQGYEGAPQIGGANHGAAPTLGSSFMAPFAQGGVNAHNNNAAEGAGLTEWGVKQALENLKTKTKLWQNNQFSEASNVPLGAELENARGSEEGLRSIGSLLGTGASLGTLAALTQK